MFKAEMLTYILGVFSFSRFVRLLYRDEMPKFFVWMAIYPSALYAGLVLITPVRFYMKFLEPYQYLTMAIMVICITGSIRAVLKRRIGSVLFTMGFLIMVVAVMNDILLFNGSIRGSIAMTHYGLFGFILSQSLILSKRFARDYRRLQKAETEIRSLNEGLERKVHERTRTIRTIYDNVQSGFLLVDRNICVKDGFTESCHGLFRRKIKVGDSLGDLCQLDKRRKEHFILALQQVFDDLLPVEVCLAQAPSRFQVGDAYIDLQGSVVREGDETISSVLITVTDASALVKAEQELKFSRSLLKISREKNAFKDLLDESGDSLKIAEDIASKKESRDKLGMILHTLKGNFASFGLEAVASHIHQLEGHESLSAADIESIRTMIDDFLHDNAHIVGLEDSNEKKVSSEEKV